MSHNKGPREALKLALAGLTKLNRSRRKKAG